MKAYVVGGAVRDELLGLPVADRDWVVVGATPEELTQLGFKPVGKDFPVFLHPETGEEYALARTERKSGRGYKGFTVYAAPEVSLEEDLRRRDLTINAMARDDAGALIDPFGGARDLKAGVLRHVSEAFAEDPVRILRVARFAARYGFRVAGETMDLMRRVAEAGELEHLVAERVWQELARGLSEPEPQLMFEVLEACGALARLVPEVQAIRADGTRRKAFGAALERAVASLPVRFALIAWFLPAEAVAGCEQAMTGLCERLRAPTEARELALAVCRCKALLEGAASEGPAALLELLKRADAFRRGERFQDLRAVARAADPGEACAAAMARAERALQAAAAVDGGAIAAAAPAPAEIPARIDDARTRAIAAALRP
jgi:tRNA nucleotidyltransferase (CCA-adding enzyme)